MQIFLFVFIWLRGTLPRLRYDQFMKFGWKFLIPASIAWIVIVSIARLVRNEYAFTSQQILFLAAGALVVVIVIGWIVSSRSSRRDAEQQREAEESANAEFDAFAGGFPVPPMPGQKFTYTPRRSAVGASAPTTEAHDG